MALKRKIDANGIKIYKVPKCDSLSKAEVREKQFVRPASEWMASEWREKQWYIEALHRDTEGTRPLKEEYRKELVPRQRLIERYN